MHYSKPKFQFFVTLQVIMPVYKSVLYHWKIILQVFIMSLATNLQLTACVMSLATVWHYWQPTHRYRDLWHHWQKSFYISPHILCVVTGNKLQSTLKFIYLWRHWRSAPTSSQWWELFNRCQTNESCSLKQNFFLTKNNQNFSFPVQQLSGVIDTPFTLFSSVDTGTAVFHCT